MNNKQRVIVLGLAILVPAGAMLAGCDDETHPPPEIRKAAMDQRMAQQPGQHPKAPPTGAPAPGAPQ